MRRHVQRVSPVDGMCLASDSAIRQLVSSLTEAFTTAWEPSSRYSPKEEPSNSAPADRPPILFAVAFKSRFGPQKSQKGTCGKEQACEDSSAANAAADAAANAGSLDDQCGRGHQPDKQQGPQASEDPGTHTPSHKGGSTSSQHDEVIPGTDDSSFGTEVRSARKAKPQELQVGQTGSANKPISRGIAIAAAAESFAASCKDANICAKVDLKQPSVVICLEILPKRNGAIAAVSIVDSKACTLKPKLTLKPLQMQADK